jgi:hypothetical protein
VVCVLLTSACATDAVTLARVACTDYEILTGLRAPPPDLRKAGAVLAREAANKAGDAAKKDSRYDALASVLSGQADLVAEEAPLTEKGFANLTAAENKLLDRLDAQRRTQAPLIEGECKKARHGG